MAQLTNERKENKYWKPLIKDKMICGYLVEVYQTFQNKNVGMRGR
jgi:hypothetical protein